MACVVYKCKSHSSRKEDEFISFHRFPVDKVIKRQWIRIVSKYHKKFRWTTHSRLCSKHFTDDCFVSKETKWSMKWSRLHGNAVPTLNLCNKTPSASLLTKKIQSKPPVPSKRFKYIEKLKDYTSMSVDVLSNKIIHLERQLEQANNTAKKLEKRLQNTMAISKTRLLKINALKQTTRRLNKKQIELYSILEESEKRGELSKEQIMILECVSNNEMIERYLCKQGKAAIISREYDLYLKKFALTLHYLSPRAYNFVRREFADVVPHPKTISKWYQGIDGNLSFTADYMKSRVQDSDSSV